MRCAFFGAALVSGVLLIGSPESQPAQTPPADLYAGHVAPTEPRTPADEQKAFHLPPGFEAQLVAAEPDIQKPINIAFDDRGRLWVSGSREYPFPAGPDAKPRDKVLILEDFATDGRAKKITAFAEGLNIPIGLLPLGDGALIYTIPNIYRYHDAAGSGHGDRREPLYRQFGFRDTHGMTSAFTWGFDGWIYACHGYSNTSTVKAADGSSITMNSGNTYRMKVDGSHVEQFTHGQVNPFGLAWDPLGNLFSCDCETKPIYQLLRGGWYPSFGKPNDGLGFAPAMMTHNHDSTAIAGITYYAADQFPPAYRDTIFVGNVVTNRINHDTLERHGSTYRAIRQLDFLKSDDPWFRPVAIKLGPDGALYVADFYNRIIGHYEVPLDHPGRDRERGRIWRIVYRGADGKNQLQPPIDLQRATVPELVQDLAHPNLMVRMKATNQLADRADPGINEAVQAVMRPQASAWQRMHSLWVLERRHALDDQTLTAAAHDAEAGVRVHAQKVLSERKELSPALRGLAVAGLKDADAFVQRAAADALGRHPEAANIRPLLDRRHVVPAEDTHLLHVVRMALRDQFYPPETWKHVDLISWDERDARAVADVVLGLPTAEGAQFLLDHLRRHPNDRTRLTDYVHHIARYGDRTVVTALESFTRADRPEDLVYQAALLKAIVQGTQERGARPSVETQARAVELGRKLLTSGRSGSLQAGIDLVNTVKLSELSVDLAAVAADRQVDEARRKAALTALVSVEPRGSVSQFGRLLADAGEPIELRHQAARVLAQVNQPAARTQLLDALPNATARLQSEIAVGLASSTPGAEKLLEAVAVGKASARLLLERPVQVQFERAKIPDWRARVASLTRGLPPADQQLQQQLVRRREGFLKAKSEATAGAALFEKHCGVCHQLGGKGAKIGPQLDGIGIRGVDRILEDILDPNRNVDQAFRTTTLNLKSGQTIMGLLLREEGEILILADSQGKEVRVPRDAVEERSVSQLSPMPANFADQIGEQDFHNLLAFLLAQRTAK
jgi:putative heme-binding domain-containing protein